MDGYVTEKKEGEERTRAAPRQNGTLYDKRQNGRDILAVFLKAERNANKHSRKVVAPVLGAWHRTCTAAVRDTNVTQGRCNETSARNCCTAAQGQKYSKHVCKSFSTWVCCGSAFFWDQRRRILLLQTAVTESLLMAKCLRICGEAAAAAAAWTKQSRDIRKMVFRW